MDLQSFGGRGLTVIMLTAIWAVNFWRNSGLRFLWGALTGQYVVR